MFELLLFACKKYIRGSRNVGMETVIVSTIQWKGEASGEALMTRFSLKKFDLCRAQMLSDAFWLNCCARPLLSLSCYSFSEFRVGLDYCRWNMMILLMTVAPTKCKSWQVGAMIAARAVGFLRSGCNMPLAVYNGTRFLFSTASSVPWTKPGFRVNDLSVDQGRWLEVGGQIAEQLATWKKQWSWWFTSEKACVLTCVYVMHAPRPIECYTTDLYTYIYIL